MRRDASTDPADIDPPAAVDAPRRHLVPIDPDLAPSDPSEPSVAARPSRPGRHPSRLEPDVLAVIAAGGMIGATARYALAQALPTGAVQFPWATFWTNLTGCLVLGFGLVVLLERYPPTRRLRPFLATGILGAYTTMSTYLVETAILIKDGHATTGLTYGIGTVVAGLALTYVGIVAARRLPGRPARDATA